MQPTLDNTTAFVGSTDFLSKPYTEAIDDFMTRLRAYAEKQHVYQPKIETTPEKTTIWYELVGVGFVIKVQLNISPDPRDLHQSTIIESHVLVQRTLSLQ